MRSCEGVGWNGVWVGEMGCGSAHLRSRTHGRRRRARRCAAPATAAGPQAPHATRYLPQPHRCRCRCRRWIATAAARGLRTSPGPSSWSTPATRSCASRRGSPTRSFSPHGGGLWGSRGGTVRCPRGRPRGARSRRPWRRRQRCPTRRRRPRRPPWGCGGRTRSIGGPRAPTRRDEVKRGGAGGTPGPRRGVRRREGMHREARHTFKSLSLSPSPSLSLLSPSSPSLLSPSVVSVPRRRSPPRPGCPPCPPRSSPGSAPPPRPQRPLGPVFGGTAETRGGRRQRREGARCVSGWCFLAGRVFIGLLVASMLPARGKNA